MAVDMSAGACGKLRGVRAVAWVAPCVCGVGQYLLSRPEAPKAHSEVLAASQRLICETWSSPIGRLRLTEAKTAKM